MPRRRIAKEAARPRRCVVKKAAGLALDEVLRGGPVSYVLVIDSQQGLVVPDFSFATNVAQNSPVGFPVKYRASFVM